VFNGTSRAVIPHGLFFKRSRNKSKKVEVANLKDRERLLQGKCSKCEYSRMYGGCRGRSLAHNGDVFAEDPSCFIKTAVSLPQEFSLSS